MFTSANSPPGRNPCCSRNAIRLALSCRAPETNGPPIVARRVAELGQARFRPGQRLGLDPGPFILRQHLAVEGRVFAQNRIADQLALAVVPQANVLLRVQVAGHHEEPEHQLADVRIAPVVGARTRLHQQIVICCRSCSVSVRAGRPRVYGCRMTKVCSHRSSQWLFRPERAS